MAPPARTLPANIPGGGLRHTWATLALRAGVHPRVVQERLGHATIGITLDVFSHVTAGMGRPVRDQSVTNSATATVDGRRPNGQCTVRL
jgi:integrase